jgi:hypothetical protein
MKYMLLICEDEQGWMNLPEAELQQIMAEYRQFTQQIKANGQHIDGAQLQPTSAATSVRLRNGKRMVTDGPFAETREQLGGYYLVDARDLDEAIALAAQIPAARTGTVEIRPLMEVRETAPA